MDWTDLTRGFRNEIKAAMIQYVLHGETQPIVDIVQSIQEESFEDGCKYIIENINEFYER